jgi:acetyl-CoA acyltransferase
MNQSKVFFVEGLRTPFVKSFGLFEDCTSLGLFARTIEGLLKRLPMEPTQIGEIIAGIVVPQVKSPNVARDAVLTLRLPYHIHGHTVNRACISGLQSVIEGMRTLQLGRSRAVIAGGVECLSDLPLTYSKEAQKFFLKLTKSPQKLQLLKSFHPSDWIPKAPDLMDPATGISVGELGERMAQKNRISRQAQDLYALESHRKASTKEAIVLLKKEIIPICPPPRYGVWVDRDDSIQTDLTLKTLQEAAPVFDPLYGSITAQTSAALCDGAAACLIADEKTCKEQGLSPKLRLLDYQITAVDPWDEPLIGPALAIPRLLQRHSLTLQDIHRFEIHEAFGAQILACLQAMDSQVFCKEKLGLTKPFGRLDPDKLNVNGGSLAMGHPFGASGTRLLITMANEMGRGSCRGALGVVGICGGSGMAAALLVEGQ